MAITFSGLATGLDTDSIVSELMALERAPLDRVEAKKTQEAERLSAYKQFKDKLDTLKSVVGDMNLTSQIRSTSVALNSEASFSATTSSGAIGSYDISVAQLSQVQKTISDGYSSKTSSDFGSGTISVNGSIINVDSENNSLTGLAKSFNDISDTTGVRATIINDGSDADNYHLVFTGKDSSTSFTIEPDLITETGTELTFNTTDVRSAQQAVVFIDGIKVVSGSNTIADAISGVTIELNSVSEMSYNGTSDPVTDPPADPPLKPWEWADPPVYKSTIMNIQADTDSLKEKVTGFVTAYNDVMDWIKSGYEEFGGGEAASLATGEDEEASLGYILRGDTSINSVKRQLQNVLTDTINNTGTFNILAEIGIKTNIDGTLSQNNSKLDTALENNFDDLVALLAGDDDVGGVMKNFNSMLLGITSTTTGMYATQKNSYESKISSFDLQISQMELRFDKREFSLRSQFTAMESLVSNLNAQGDFLTQQLDILNGNN